MDTSFLNTSKELAVLLITLSCMKCCAMLQSETADKHRTVCYTGGKDKYILHMLACVLEDPLLVSAVADNLHKLQSHSFSKTKLVGR